MTKVEEHRYVRAFELVERLAGETGSEIRIERNGGATVEGVLVRSYLDFAEVDGRPHPVVHLLLHRRTDSGDTTFMVSLLTGAYPDADFFWPVCPITIRNATGRERVMLRSWD